MKKFAGITIVILIVFGLSCITEAALIGSFDVQRSGGSNQIITSGDALDAEVWYNHPTEYPKIFDSLTVSATDIGTEFFATSSSGSNPDPGFDAFVNYITDGTDQIIYVELIGGVGNYESIRFGTSPDFQGYTINAFGIILNNLSLDSPGEDPNEDGIWTDHSWGTTFNVYGTSAPVPEPATMFLLGSGLIGLVGFRRKKLFKE